MSSKQNLTKALRLVDRLQGMPDKERQLLKEHVLKAANGDDEALGHIILSSYDAADRGLVGEILSLVLQQATVSLPENESQNRP